MAATIITKDNYSNEVLLSEIPVLIDFWAPWCGSCRTLMPSIEKMAEEFSGKYKICKVDVDEQPELARQFNVRSIPTLVVMKDSRVVNKSTGVRSIPAMVSMIEQ